MKSNEAMIEVNGHRQAVGLPCSIAQLLEQAGLKVTQVVVECNGSVLSKTSLTESFLKEGDRLEVIVPVAGG
jgi:sulfur carrier protein